MKTFSYALLCGIFSLTPAWADSLDFEFVREDQIVADPDRGKIYQSISVDPATGKFYQRSHYEGTHVWVFEDRTAFETITPSDVTPLDSVTLADPGYYGTYVTASQGILYGRTSNTTETSAAGFNLATGATEKTVASFADMDGGKTFDWGGYTAVNFFQDGTDMYVLGKDTSGSQTWQLSRIDADMTVLETKTFVGTEEIGFATLIGGHLFMGEHYNVGAFDHAFDFSTSQYSAVDFQFAGIGDPIHIDNLLYSPADDTLYLHNYDTFGIYKVGDVSAALGVGQAVPEGGNFAMALLLLCGMHRVISLRSAKS